LIGAIMPLGLRLSQIQRVRAFAPANFEAAAGKWHMIRIVHKGCIYASAG
jgi:hypothetical protein